MLIQNIKISKIPTICFYTPDKGHTQRMINLKTGKTIGEMSVIPRKELYIERLFINQEERKKGYGTKFLDYARLISKKLNLKGNLRVLASTFSDKNSIPSHAFYRKYGFTSDNKKVLDKIDECIKNNKKLSIKDAPPTYMYYINK